MSRQSLCTERSWKRARCWAACVWALALSPACSDSAPQTGNVGADQPAGRGDTPTAGTGVGGPGAAAADAAVDRGEAGKGAAAGQGSTAGQTAAAGQRSMAGDGASDSGSSAANDAGEPMGMEDAASMPSTDAGPDDASAPPRMDLGVGDGRDVVTIGDSWMDYALSGGGIEGGLRRAGKNYRNYSLSGTRFLNGVIPRQYDTAKARDPKILTVIMTGGGNDILQGAYNCDTAEGCARYIKDLTAGLNTLWTKMSADGVKDVIYISYSSDSGRPPPDSARPTKPPPGPEICTTGPIRCHSLGTTNLVMGDLVDGIHPSRAANTRIATALLELMEKEGMRR
jgi:hypothetical protein